MIIRRMVLDRRTLMVPTPTTKPITTMNAMKLTIPSLVAGCLLVCGSLLAADRADAKPTPVMPKVKAELAQLQKLLSTANSSLRMMRQNADVNAVKELKILVKQLDKTADEARRNAIVMQARATEHYNTWLDTIEGLENKEIRDKAKARYAKVRSEYDKFLELANKARKEYLPVVSDIEDIIIYLEADPSKEALKSLSSSISSMQPRSESVIKSISAVMKQMEIARAAIPQK